MIMEKATNNIKDPKVRAYFDDVTEGKTKILLKQEIHVC